MKAWLKGKVSEGTKEHNRYFSFRDRSGKFSGCYIHRDSAKEDEALIDVIESKHNPNIYLVKLPNSSAWLEVDINQLRFS